MPTMRTINQAIALIKAQDKDSCLTKNALRQFIINNQLPACRIGKKYLINMEVLEDFLQGNIMPIASQVGVIRKLGERIT